MKYLLFALLISTGLISHGQTKPVKINHPQLAMNDQAVDAILTAMRNQSTDEGKLNLIRVAIKNNTDGVTAQQEVPLLNQFSNDDMKLECAKFLYPWLVDVKNYSKIQYTMGSPTVQKAFKDFAVKH